MLLLIQQILRLPRNKFDFKPKIIHTKIFLTTYLPINVWRTRTINTPSFQVETEILSKLIILSKSDNLISRYETTQILLTTNFRFHRPCYRVSFYKSLLPT